MILKYPGLAISATYLIKILKEKAEIWIEYNVNIQCIKKKEEKIHFLWF